MGSVRITPPLDAKVRQIAASKGITRSEVFRRALQSYCDQELNAAPGSRFDDIIGVVDVPGDISAHTREEFGSILNEKFRGKTGK